MNLPKVLFVCVENSCRSQMAEGFAKALGQGKIEAASAGSKPSGKVNETAVRMMAEIGIDLSAHQSKGLDSFASVRWDYVITMGCGDACPFVPSQARLDWQIPDPKHLPPEEFRKVRDLLRDKVSAFLREILHA